ncbi:hypothetical protein FHX42_001418 [Saccharopolyspora lacisalsi]|uniref:Uncharacterized protein n=1 Tax=Halosaccharopolyspora lacisalsi TaxID=1000566 RepID=A0A839DTL0_9PSEU|nr:hypothetical protein [Halosaccharopolyspora lacisalsi]MBA8824089.1 hypothetical protein [Halosaccharopolyspora lacisalsi]
MVVQDPAGKVSVRALWTAIVEGEQRRSIRMLLRVLSLATTQPDVYGSFAATAVEVMLEPTADGFRRAGHTPEGADASATFVVSGLRGLCQDLLVTGDSDRDARGRRGADRRRHGVADAPGGRSGADLDAPSGPTAAAGGRLRRVRDQQDFARVAGLQVEGVLEPG